MTSPTITLGEPEFAAPALCPPNRLNAYFLSHSSRQKPLVRELRQALPHFVDTWIDEQGLLVGDVFPEGLEQTILADADFVLLFLDRDAAESQWVQKEIEWALLREKEVGRPVLLPLIIDADALGLPHLAPLRDRTHLRLYDFTAGAIKSVGHEVTMHLFAWISRDLERMAIKPAATEDVSVIADADRLMAHLAEEIRAKVYRYRQDEPLLLRELFSSLGDHEAVSDLAYADFLRLIRRLQRAGHLAGLVYSRDVIYVEEEHFSWKTTTQQASKARIAEAALSLIEDGALVVLDAGSTTLEIARLLAEGLRLEHWHRLCVFTNSVPAASELLIAASELGLEDGNDVVEVVIAGGRARANTLAIVPPTVGPHAEGDAWSFATALFAERKGPAVAFVGANGVNWAAGFTTHSQVEATTKSRFLSLVHTKVIVADESKLDVCQAQVFAPFSEELTFVTATNSSAPFRAEYAEKLEGAGVSVVIA